MPGITPYRIALDCRYARPHFPGIGRYVSNLAAGFAELDLPDISISLITNPEQYNSSFDMTALAAKNPGQIRLVETNAKPFSLSEQWELPRLAWQHKFALWHAPYYIRPYLMPCPVILTAYDLIGKIVPGAISGKKALVAFEVTTRLAFRTSRLIITLSQSAAQDITRLYRVNPVRLKVVAPGLEPDFRPLPPEERETVRRKLDLPEHYILYVGINKPHKNLLRLLEAFQIYRRQHPESEIRLVLAGREDSRYSLALRQKVAELELEKVVSFRGEVLEAELVALYNCATLYVQPSLYEGYGLPVLEAQACGTSVICSNTGSLPEAAGEHVPLFDPYRSEDIASKIELILSDSLLMLRQREKGLARAARFSLKQAAMETIRVYQELL